MPDPRVSIVLAAMTVPAALVAGVSPWRVLGVAVTVWGGTNAFMARKVFSDTSKMDNALPAFTQYITDSRMEGMEIWDAVRTRSKNNDKKDALGPVLRDISKQMMFGRIPPIQNFYVTGAEYGQHFSYEHGSSSLSPYRACKVRLRLSRAETEQRT